MICRESQNEHKNGKWRSTLTLPKKLKLFFSRKTMKPFHPKVFSNEVPVEHSVSKKHLVNTLMKKSLKHSKEYQSLKAL